MDEGERKSCSFRSNLPWRRKVERKRTGKLGLTTANSLAPKVNDQSQWVWPNVVVDEEAKKEIVVEALARMVGIFCGTQTYTFGGKIFLRKAGLLIGPRATCAIARIVMSTFDYSMTGRMEELGLKTDLKTRYMDDIRKIMSALRKGTVYRNSKLTHSHEKGATDQFRSPERITADILVEIMNEQMPGINFTSEIREDFPDEWGLPTLDTVMKMEEKGEVVGRMVAI